MSRDIAEFQARLDDLSGQFEAFLADLAQLRKISPQMKAESAKLLERYLIEMSRMLKQVSKENHDDLLEGISFLKIKMMS